jgi:hypothetical protein
VILRSQGGEQQRRLGLAEALHQHMMSLDAAVSAAAASRRNAECTR